MEPTSIAGMEATDEEKKQALRQQGIPEDLIAQILGMANNDPSGLNKQYDMSAYLRRGAFGEQSKSLPGAIAQGIMGGMAGKMDKDYSTELRRMRKDNIAGRGAWFDAYRNRGVRERRDPFQYFPEYGYSSAE